MNHGLAIEVINQSKTIKDTSKSVYTSPLNQLDKLGVFPMFHQPEKLWARILEHNQPIKRKKTEYIIEDSGNYHKALQKVCEEMKDAEKIAVIDERLDWVISTDPVTCNMVKKHFMDVTKVELFDQLYTKFWQSRAKARRETQEAKPKQGERNEKQKAAYKDLIECLTILFDSADQLKNSGKYQYQFVVAALTQAFGDLVLRNDLEHTVIQDF
ncbi:hypothetical protein HDV00_000275 [Rhizophlyctis rosea]|nr:hypothetical protein HDV00_000275 [Rhizophlyctis rosea]